MRLHYPFLLLAFIYVCAVLAQMALLPPFEGGDEGLHLAYTQTILNDARLPDRTESATNGARQASGQPPLYYAAGALLAWLLHTPMMDDVALWTLLESGKNLWFAPPDIWNRLDNRNLYVGGAANSPGDLPIATTDRVLRFLSLGFGLLGMLGAYGVARETLRLRWALVATAAFAFSPQYVNMSAIFHNDIAAYALCALVLWQSLRLLSKGATAGRLLVLGTLAGLAGLAKINGLLIVPAAGAAIMLQAWRHRPVFRRVLRNGTLAVLPAALLMGPWLAYGLMNSGDPLGMTTHQRPGYAFEIPLTLGETIPLWPEVYLGYWGKLASAVYLTPLMYTLLGSLVALAMAGYVLGRKTRWWRGDLRREQMIVLGLAALVSAVGILYWVQHIHFITGRLAYPAHAAFAVALAGGLALLARRFRRPRVVAGWTVAVLVFAACIAAPVSLIAAYAPVDTRADVPGSLQGSPLDFAPAPGEPAAIRFLGFQSDSETLSPGHSLHFTVCWQALEGSPPARSAAFALKAFTEAGDHIADRTSLLGLGRYPSALWQPGDRVCDVVDVPVTDAVQPGEVVNLLLVLLDAETQAVDWEARSTGDGQVVPIPVIGTLTG